MRPGQRRRLARREARAQRHPMRKFIASLRADIVAEEGDAFNRWSHWEQDWETAERGSKVVDAWLTLPDPLEKWDGPIARLVIFAGARAFRAWERRQAKR